MAKAIQHQELESLLPEVQGLWSQIALQGILPYSYQGLLCQLLTGVGPEWTGVYDDVKVVDYDVVPTATIKEIAGKLIWDTVRAMGKATHQTKGVPSETLPEFVYTEIQSGGDIVSLYKLTTEQIVTVLILPEVASPARPINVNNFLENKGLLERGVDGNIRWEETLAYHVGHGQVRINLIGRERKGVVTPGQEYDQVRNALARMFQEQWRDSETESSVVSKVWEKEELYDDKGDHFIYGPDLVLTFSSGYKPSAKSIQLGFDDKEIGNTDKTDIVIDNALMLIGGNGIKQRYSGASHTLDVLPTVLYLLDLPLPRTLPGKVIQEVFTSEFRNDHPVHYQTDSDLTQAEEALLMDRLEALGYID
jgi:predicted AlkP superfamily phosphohydrolase/phosphomutase